MNSSRVLVFSLVLLTMFSGCGGGSSNHFNFNDVTVSVAPPSATVAAGGQVTLQATVSNCGSPCPAPALTWAIAEIQVNGASGAQCNWQGSTPPTDPCPDGTIEGADTTSVTYHAPSTSGTFHVIASESSVVNNVPVTKSGTAAITVP